MTKQEILAIVNDLPEDKEIDLIVYDGSDNWSVENVFVENFDGYDTAELVFHLNDSFMVTNAEDESDDNFLLECVLEDMELKQEFIDFSPENGGVHLSDLVVSDSLPEIELFISCAKRDHKKFTKADLMSVINGSYPYLDGVNVVGLYEHTIELEVKHRYKKWGAKEEKCLDCKFPPMTTEEAFIKYFKEYQLRFSYCNYDKHRIVDDDLRSQYFAWLTVGNYAKHGGRMD